MAGLTLRDLPRSACRRAARKGGQRREEPGSVSHFEIEIKREFNGLR
jgi:hypothetical protein